MTEAPRAEELLEPEGVAAWLHTDVAWVEHAIAQDGLPVLGRRTDGTPLMAAGEVRAWLRARSTPDDRT